MPGSPRIRERLLKALGAPASWRDDPLLAATVTLESGAYPVYVGWDVLESQLGDRLAATGFEGRAFILTDSNVVHPYARATQRSLHKAGIEMGLGVQYSSTYFTDNSYLLDIAAKYDRIIPIVILDATAAETPETLRTMAKDNKIAGVRFMGETAKILNPEKRVLMPDLEATCSLDIGCPVDEFSAFCDQHPDRTVVVYANTSAAVKARADWMREPNARLRRGRPRNGSARSICMLHEGVGRAVQHEHDCSRRRRPL